MAVAVVVAVSTAVSVAVAVSVPGLRFGLELGHAGIGSDATA